MMYINLGLSFRETLPLTDEKQNILLVNLYRVSLPFV